MESAQVTYIFFHIPKTGGTTFRIHLQDQLLDQVEFIHLANKGDKWAKKMNLPSFEDRSSKSRNKARVLLGHMVDFQTKSLIPNNNVQEIVFFRDPTDWEISRYNQMMNRRVKHNKPVIPFEKWYSQIEKTHSQFDWFLAKYLKIGPEIHKFKNEIKKDILFSTLNHFKYVCFLDQIDSFARFFYEKLCVENTAKPKNVVGKDKKNYFDASPKNIQLLNQHSQYETELYNQVKSTFGKHF